MSASIETGKPAIRVEGVSHFEGDAELLSKISFSVNFGEIVGVLGPNGSGKSTLLQVISGLRGRGAGVCISDTKLESLSQRERAGKIVYVGDDCSTEFPLTAEETVMIGRYALGSEGLGKNAQSEIERVMVETGCAGFKHRYVDQLSGGERQRVAFARALVQGAKVLCLDESFSKLDVHHQVKMGSLLRRLAGKGYAILVVSHDLNYTAQWADRLLLLRSGRLVSSGRVDEVLTEPNLQALYPDADFQIERTASKIRVYFTSSEE